jgi:integrase/recombinase XerD
MKIGSIRYQFFIYKAKTNLKGRAPIYCKLLFEGKIKLLSTGINVYHHQWDASKYCISSKDELNKKIFEVWKSKLSKLLFDIYVKENPPDLENIAAILSGKTTVTTGNKTVGFLKIFNTFITTAKKQIGEQYTYRTVQKFITIYNTVEEFLTKTYTLKDIAVDQLKLMHLLQYEEYCLIHLKHKQITVNKSVQMLKQIIRYAIGHGYLDRDPWILHKSKNVIIDIVYLDVVQLETIKNASNLSEKLCKTRDCFIFSCYSGLAYAEIAAINKDNIVVKNNINWISMKRKKTQRSFLIPMLPPAQDIWDKYDGKLPVLSNQKYNKNLKELAVQLNLNVNLCTHLARKTFTTTVLLGNNIPLKVASTLLGHSNTRITEKHYAEVTNDLLEQHVESLFDIFK